MYATSVRVAGDRDTQPIVALSLRAWRPVFESFERIWGRPLFERFYPDWPTQQATAVGEALDTNPTWVVTVNATVSGFVNVIFNDETRVGEIHMIAVDPDCQRRGLATLLTQHAISEMRSRGMTLAIVSTGGDPGHAPARATYERNGFIAFPQVLYSTLL
jgi:ribosomal protein S18 acetylase RimI-like enzyme